MHMTRPLLIGGLSALLGLSALALAPARAAGDGEVLRFQGENATRRITMGVGKSLILELPTEAGEIFVGNPNVANAVVRSARKIYVIGQTTGQTTIFAMDKQGRRIATLELSIGRDIGELSSIVQTALPNSKIVARTVNDSIILTGEVESASEMQTALDIAKGFAESVSKGGGGSAGMVVNAMTIRGRDQVMIKVTIAEVQRSITKQLGITSSSLMGKWGSFTQDNPFSLNGQSASSGAIKTFSNFGGGNTLTQTLQAFERNGVARIMAEPTVTAVSGESAKFTVGGEVPISSGTNCTSGTGSSTVCTVSVTYKTYGVTLNFTPVVLSAGRISLRLATEVADIDPSTTVSTSTVSAPGFRTRKNETTIELPSGGSIATAGLIQSNSSQAINGVPGLMNLPILGSLFRSRDYKRQETELMIIVTPYIAKAVSANALARPDENYADSNDPQAWLLGRVNKLYSTADNPEAAKRFSGRVGFIHD